MKAQLIWTVAVCCATQACASFLGEHSLIIESKEALSSIDGCIRKIKEVASGKTLIASLLKLWQKYLQYEPHAQIKILEGGPEFKGSDTKTPVKSSSGCPSIEIYLDIEKDPVMTNCSDSDRESRIVYYKRQKRLGEAVTIDADGFVSINVCSIWADDDWQGQCVQPTADEYKAYFARKGIHDVEVRHKSESGFKNPALHLRCPVSKTEDAISEDQCVTHKSQKDIVSTSKQPTKLFIAVAHELLHLKHFLEERVFICEIVNGLIAESKACAELAAELRAFCSSMVSLPDDETLRNLMIGEAKSPNQLKKLCALAARFNIESNFNILSELSDRSQLTDIAYSCCDNIDSTSIDILRAFPEWKYLNIQDRTQLRSLIKDFEELRTVIGPDRDGIAESTIRFEFGEYIRFIYQNHEVQITAEGLKEVLGFNDQTFKGILSDLTISSS